MLNLDNFFESMDCIVKKRIEELQYDQTKVYKIINNDKRKEGKYTVTDDENSTFTAYSLKDDYAVGQYVYVLIPMGDLSQNKIITGRYIVNDNEPYDYISPLEQFTEIGEPIYSNIKDIFALKAGSNINKKQIASGSFSSIGDTLNIQATFSSLLRNYKNSQGNFGLEIQLGNLEEKVFKSNYTFRLDSSDMYGEIYNLDSIVQTKNFNINELTNITYYELYFYQENFKMQPIVNLDNLLCKNVKITSGINISNYSEETVVLFSKTNSIYYTKTATTEITPIFLLFDKNNLLKTYTKDDIIIGDKSQKDKINIDKIEIYKRFNNGDWILVDTDIFNQLSNIVLRLGESPTEFKIVITKDNNVISSNILSFSYGLPTTLELYCNDDNNGQYTNYFSKTGARNSNYQDTYSIYLAQVGSKVEYKISATIGFKYTWTHSNLDKFIEVIESEESSQFKFKFNNKGSTSSITGTVKCQVDANGGTSYVYTYILHLYKEEDGDYQILIEDRQTASLVNEKGQIIEAFVQNEIQNVKSENDKWVIVKYCKVYNSKTYEKYQGFSSNENVEFFGPKVVTYDILGSYPSYLNTPFTLSLNGVQQENVTFDIEGENSFSIQNNCLVCPKFSKADINYIIVKGIVNTQTYYFPIIIDRKNYVNISYFNTNNNQRNFSDVLFWYGTINSSQQANGLLIGKYQDQNTAQEFSGLLGLSDNNVIFKLGIDGSFCFGSITHSIISTGATIAQSNNYSSGQRTGSHINLSTGAMDLYNNNYELKINYGDTIFQYNYNNNNYINLTTTGDAYLSSLDQQKLKLDLAAGSFYLNTGNSSQNKFIFNTAATDADNVLEVGSNTSNIQIKKNGQIYINNQQLSLGGGTFVTAISKSNQTISVPQLTIEKVTVKDTSGNTCEVIKNLTITNTEYSVIASINATTSTKKIVLYT